MLIRLLWLGVFAPLLLCLDEPTRPQPKTDVMGHVQLPPGFRIEQIAGPPLVQHPMHVAFDDRMHLYVTEAAGVNRNAQQLEKELPNSIKRLTDTHGDGKYDQATTFADKLTFPGGVLFHQGAVYATSFPYLWKFVDRDGDGVADERTPLVGKFGSVGNGADLHGPQLGPDGWLYFCDGRNGHELTLGDGKKLKGRSSGLYRCKPDGSGLERIFAGGMDNPVEIAFTAVGEPLVCTNLVLNSPRHDAILYGLEGAVYPYDLKAVQEQKWTGGYLPFLDLGWVAVSSVLRYDHAAWGPAWRDHYFTAEFNTHRVRQHTIARDGAGFKIESRIFLTCSHPDFHPTQISLAPDGSMILVDTGGWFRNGCPQSQVAKPEIDGGIYRIYQEHQGSLAKAAPFTAAQRDPRQSTSEIWTQVRAGMLEKETVQAALSSADLDKVIAGLRAIGLTRDIRFQESLVKALDHGNPAVRREAATALERTRQASAAPALVMALAQAEDPFLEHALIHALLSLGNVEETLPGLTHSSPRVQRGALLALSQMAGETLTWEHVAPLLQREDARLKDAALWVVGQRRGWVVELADYLNRELQRKHIEPGAETGLRQLILALAREPAVQQVAADRLACPETPGVVRMLLLEVMAQADLARWPAVWTGPVRGVLHDSAMEDAIVLQAIQCAGASRERAFDGELRQLAESTTRGMEIRIAAAAIGLQDGKPVQDALLSVLLRACQSTEDPVRRLSAARALCVAHLNEKQLVTLAKTVGQAGPLELPLLLGAWERQPSAAAWKALLQALPAAPGVAALNADRLGKLLDTAPIEFRTDASALFHRFGAGPASQKDRLERLQKVLTGGDVKTGREIFYGAKSTCSACHRVGEQGGLVGPQLSQIGAVRSRMDLLEALVFPSASLARGFETLVVVTKEGKTITGVITRETADALVLTDSQRQEQKVLRSDIEQMTSSPVSIMPQGMDQTLSQEELRHLLAFLESLKK